MVFPENRRPELCYNISMEILEKVQEFARKAHGNQQRKFEPEPYVTHLIRVKKLCEQYTNDITILAAALLHDTLEDTPVTGNEILEFLTPLLGEEDAKRTRHFVVELTDVYIKKNYPQWNRRTRKSKEAERLALVSAGAQTIKYADIIDNSLTIVNADDDFVRTYLSEAKALLHKMESGNESLRTRALITVEDCLAILKD